MNSRGIGYGIMEAKTAAIRSLLEREDLASEQRDHKIVFPGGMSSVLCYFWREKVAQWCYDVVDHLDEDRSIVYIAMNILDRYCAAKVPTHPMDEKLYEIASLSSIFLAIRIAGSRELLLNELVSMSREGISIQDIVKMGTSVIGSLTWESSILTPMDFVQLLLQLLPTLSKTSQTQLVLDSASYLIELAVCDSFFSQFKASRLAIAAILIALETHLSATVDDFKDVTLKATSINLEAGETLILCGRLHSIYSRSVDNRRQCGPHLIEDDGDAESVETGTDIRHNDSKQQQCSETEDDIVHPPKRFKSHRQM